MNHPVLETLGDWSIASNDGRIPFKHQRQAVHFMVATKYHGNILALDVGLGKTMASLLAAKALQLYFGYNIYVISPPNVKGVWLREAQGIGVDIEVFSSGKIPAPADLPETDYVLLADEAHLFQNIRARRSQAFLALAHDSRCKRCYPITGTPDRNGRPIDLLPLLKSIKHPLASNIKSYQERYCAATLRNIPGGAGRKYLDVSGASNLPELHSKLKDVIMYKKKRDCLDMPATMDIAVPVALSEAAQERYRETLERLEAEHEQRVQAKEQELLALFPEQVKAIIKERQRLILQKREIFERKLPYIGNKSLIALNPSIFEIVEKIIDEYRNPYLFVDIQNLSLDAACFSPASWLSEEQETLLQALARQGDSLVALGQIMHAASIAKAESAVDLAEEILKQGSQVVIFTIFQDTADLIASELAARFDLAFPLLSCTGRAPAKAIQQQVDAFQSQRECKPVQHRTFIATYGACGVGITLTQAQDMILVDRPWVPTDVHQAKGRIDRVGQTGTMSFYWLQYGASDERIDSLLSQKQARIDTILEGKEAQSQNDIITPDLAEMLVQATFREGKR